MNLFLSTGGRFTTVLVYLYYGSNYWHVVGNFVFRGGVSLRITLSKQHTVYLLAALQFVFNHAIPLLTCLVDKAINTFINAEPFPSTIKSTCLQVYSPFFNHASSSIDLFEKVVNTFIRTEPLNVV